jgi:serine/threonine-protein kinase
MFIAQQIGRYHLLDRIAFGGMAEIYRAKTFDSRGLEHMVAIKRVLRHLAEDDDFLQMLVDEAKIASLLDHVNIAKVYEFVRFGEDYFIAMEYVDGKDVRSILDRCRANGTWLPVEDCAYIIMRIMEGLHSAHERLDGAGNPLNIVHRDVSPSNVIVSYKGHIKLCDFGIAKAKLSRIQTRTGVIKGKVKYMSPEQAMGRPLDRRSDIFSGGSVLYEMLTKQCPFQAENEMELIFKVRDAKYAKPTRFNPNVPPPLEKILRKALARSANGRYPTARAFADDLNRFIQESVPNYAPARLGRLLREWFAEDIERDLRRLEEFVLDEPDPSQTGENLLAEVLGQAAPYTQFTAAAPADLSADTNYDATKMLPRVPPPETRLPEGVDLHELKTQIFDPEEREGRVLKRRHRPRPGSSHKKDASRYTQQATVHVQLEKDPAEELGPAIHDMKTQILDRTVDDSIEQPPDGGTSEEDFATDPVGYDDDQTDER